MAKVVEAGRADDIRHFLIGGGPGVALRAGAELQRRFPGAIIAGSVSPPFRELDSAEVNALSDIVQAANADILWVGLGTPKQDYFAYRISAHLEIPIATVGAAFDFLAGTLPEAPVWMQRVGLEWLFRLISEPRRLFRRYTVELLRFALAVRRSGIVPIPCE
jgi:N-acetylglucosaminyldiphosphoundecaprenol N-acetyl-beta-D-mannosaminyltransferase